MTAQPLRVFVVEDHQDTLKALRFYLEQSGHVVQSASTKADAIAGLSACSCDLLLSDIALSDGTGWELMSELGPARPRYAVAMSGFGSNADAARSKTVGFRQHLIKPLDPDLLDHQLAAALRERDRA
jgi:DNA-binding response OmpR family regulator